MAYKHRNRKKKGWNAKESKTPRVQKEIYMLYDLSLLSQLHAY